MIHYFRKKFAPKRRVNAKTLTAVRGSGSNTQVYNSQTGEWIFWYLIIFTDNCGNDVCGSDISPALAMKTIDDASVSVSDKILGNTSPTYGDFDSDNLSQSRHHSTFGGYDHFNSGCSHNSSSDYSNSSSSSDYSNSSSSSDYSSSSSSSSSFD